MGTLLIAALVATLGWWLSTGVILYLNLMPRPSHRWSLLAIGLGAVLGLTLVPGIAGSDGSGAAIAGFGLALLIWGWLEMTYLMGFLTGTHKRACPEHVSGWPRFRMALGTSLYHELAVVATGLLLLKLSAGGVNPVTAQAFLVLWIMRWSAKLNLFLGVPNFNEHWLPEHSRHLLSYMPKRRMNILFPVSITGSTVAAVVLGQYMLAAADPVSALRHGLVLCLLGLGIVEHWLLVLPLNDSALWRWASGNSGPEASPCRSEERPRVRLEKSHDRQAGDGHDPVAGMV